ncbi:hypothetical protein IQ268_29180 [Oculatella sp. LEGE 06141]|nr:hypothetical protein [Oculatella sp. LEGE 06141]
MNRRIAKAIDSDGIGSGTAATTHFVYDRDNVILEFTSNSLSQRYLHGTQVDQVLAQENGSGETVWHLTDHLGTVKNLVDGSGAVVNYVKYDSFGKVVSETNGAIGSRYQFTGREFDAETGLYFYRARYYDASVGRFVSEDPIGFAGGDANLFGYAKNQPVNNTDPFGTTSTELTQLLTIATPRSPGSSIYRYPESPNYGIAFATATAWFYLITESERRESRDLSSRGGTVPWLLFGPLKGPTGRGVLRPVGTSGPDPTIELQPDRGGRHNTPGHEVATEVKFEYSDPDSYDYCPAIPPLRSAQEMEQQERPSLFEQFLDGVRDLIWHWPYGPLS